ncbi:MAG: hypothetical protein RJA63_3164 [Pseudomonadota bacterium]|jgi:hypothetical protein
MDPTADRPPSAETTRQLMGKEKVSINPARGTPWVAGWQRNYFSLAKATTWFLP